MDTTFKKLTICDRIEQFLKGKKGAVATLKEIYTVIQDYPEESIRTSLYRDTKDRFKKVARGVYMLKGEKSNSLLIQGDGRKMDAIEDESIDLIITDHPWEDEQAHASGNQTNFSDYEKFRYSAEDFQQKARVLKEGAYCVEFIPVESATNWNYLSDIKQMAKDAGLEYYAKITWRKAPEGKINNGRTTKGVEDILIFYKGNHRIKPRRLNGISSKKPYYTRKMLSYEVDIPANKGRFKAHQAEKPIALYEYLIEMFTEELDVCLDQFGGACNLLQAALNQNRFAIVYENATRFVDNAIRLFKPLVCYESPDVSEERLRYKVARQETVTKETLILDFIPYDAEHDIELDLEPSFENVSHREIDASTIRLNPKLEETQPNSNCCSQTQESSVSHPTNVHRIKTSKQTPKTTPIQEVSALTDVKTQTTITPMANTTTFQQGSLFEPPYKEPARRCLNAIIQEKQRLGHPNPTQDAANWLTREFHLVDPMREFESLDDSVYQQIYQKLVPFVSSQH